MLEKLEDYDILKNEYLTLKHEQKVKFFEPYDWQKEFLNASKDNPQIALLAGNRVGKTLCASALVAYHLTGDYPDWYTGHRVEYPPMVCALGVSGTQIRDVIQKELVGEFDSRTGKFWGGGMIPKAKLGPHISSTVSRNLLQELKVKHKKGGYSTLILRSYESGPQVVRGIKLDVAWVDEEPSHSDFFGELLSRTATTKGRVILTFTPENGMTPLVDQLLNHPAPGQFVKNVSWAMAPHLDEDTKVQLLAAIPKWQRKAKTEGIPSFGDSAIYQLDFEDVVIPPFEIPKHYAWMGGVDFGLNNFGYLACAQDRDTGVTYIVQSEKLKQQLPPEHSSTLNQRYRKLRWIYPHDGKNREKGSGTQLKQFYEDCGVDMYRQFSNIDEGNISVEPGLVEIQTMFREGRLKIFDTNIELLEELRKYHRDKNGRIVKVDDHLCDAMRYTVLSVGRFGHIRSEWGHDYSGPMYPKPYL